MTRWDLKRNFVLGNRAKLADEPHPARETLASRKRLGRRVLAERDTWPTVKLRLKEAGVTPNQVQAVWMKHVEAGAVALGEFPAHARALEMDMVDILNIAHQHFPNLRVAFFSSRTYAGR